MSALPEGRSGSGAFGSKKNVPFGRRPSIKRSVVIALRLMCRLLGSGVVARPLTTVHFCHWDAKNASEWRYREANWGCCGNSAMKKALWDESPRGLFCFRWRRRRDSNPRTRERRVNGFRDRRIQPLCHSSVRNEQGALPEKEVRPERLLAESRGFEPRRRFWRLHDFQSCSFGHSDNSP